MYTQVSAYGACTSTPYGSLEPAASRFFCPAQVRPLSSEACTARFRWSNSLIHPAFRHPRSLCFKLHLASSETGKVLWLSIAE